MHIVLIFFLVTLLFHKVLYIRYGPVKVIKLEPHRICSILPLKPPCVFYVNGLQLFNWFIFTSCLNFFRELIVISLFDICILYVVLSIYSNATGKQMFLFDKMCSAAKKCRIIWRSSCPLYINCIFLIKCELK